uniref:Transmembrane protein 14C-like n=1 Tax=Phallusia mammillata TaxID=59560 RepID=A0A6F9DUD6_9ASCI|nr:transmembrane protein 14C-like [Phallusia mammillata]
MGFDWVSFAYAATVASGGIIGYVKAGSSVSLGAGILFGGLAGLGAYRSSVDSSDIWLSLGISLSLGGLMGYRFYNSRKFMPAGLVAVLSIAMVARCLCNMNKPSSSKTE